MEGAVKCEAQNEWIPTAQNARIIQLRILRFSTQDQCPVFEALRCFRSNLGLG